MALQQYSADGVTIYRKVIYGKAHPTFARAGAGGESVALGIAFRTADAPLGYLPFFTMNDFDLSGQTTWKEEVMARMPINLSAAASPHTLLIQVASEDPEFTASGDGGELEDIQRMVFRDRLQQAMTAASGVFIDGIMLAIGGPTSKMVAEQLTRSAVKQFVLSKGMSAMAKSYLKSQPGMQNNRILTEQP